MRQKPARGIFHLIKALPVLLLPFLVSCGEDSWLHRMRDKRLEKIYGRRDFRREKQDLEREIRENEREIRELYEKISKQAVAYRKLAYLFAESGAFQQCVEHARLAERYGSIDGEIRQLQGLCLGNLASQNNWDPSLVREAEKAYLSALELNAGLIEAKFELALVYFYGYVQKAKEGEMAYYREKAKSLLEDYRREIPRDPRGYQLMAQLYLSEGRKEEAKKELLLALDALRAEDPQNFEKNSAYHETRRNLELLQDESRP
ncbi:MAG: hypothetical protein NZM25_08430 [Leptospiraceae bacterium]|nr:hypothetical protein [Leptospiraceae bacterium]MDW8306743.1 hypothetical protein [Leptospiraceae bacterium]